jgi:RNA polymerase sigma-70 factor, ECF subfamily
MTPEAAPLEPSDADLFARVQGGEQAAFAEFYDRHAALLYTVAHRILGGDAEAEDVLQEAAVLIWERAPAYDPRLGRPVAWAITLTRNKAIDRLRARVRKDELLSAAAAQADAAAEPAGTGTGETGDMNRLLKTTLGGLPAEQRRAIELAFFGGLSHPEVAAAVGAPLGTVKARIRRGLLALRDQLEARL